MQHPNITHGDWLAVFNQAFTFCLKAPKGNVKAKRQVTGIEADRVLNQLERRLLSWFKGSMNTGPKENSATWQNVLEHFDQKFFDSIFMQNSVECRYFVANVYGGLIKSSIDVYIRVAPMHART